MFRVTKIQNTDNTKCWQIGGAIGIPSLAGGSTECFGHFGEQFRLRTLSITVWVSSCTPIGVANCVHMKTCLFIITKTWKQPRCPLVTNRQASSHMCAMEYYSVGKRKELSSHERARGELKSMLVSERSQSEKATCSMIPTVWQSWKDNYRDSEKIQGVVEGFWGQWDYSVWYYAVRYMSL